MRGQSQAGRRKSSRNEDVTVEIERRRGEEEKRKVGMSMVAYLGTGVTSNHGRGDVSARLSFSGLTRLGKAGGVAACVVRGWWGRAWLARGSPLWEIGATGYRNGRCGL